jgi:hypothetical protein
MFKWPAHIKTAAARRAWFNSLIRDGINFHPDTRGDEYVEYDTGKRTFTKAQAAHYERLMTECFEVGGDPYEDAVNAMRRAGL